MTNEKLKQENDLLWGIVKRMVEELGATRDDELERDLTIEEALKLEDIAIDNLVNMRERLLVHDLHNPKVRLRDEAYEKREDEGRRKVSREREEAYTRPYYQKWVATATQEQIVEHILYWRDCANRRFWVNRTTSHLYRRITAMANKIKHIREDAVTYKRRIDFYHHVRSKQLDRERQELEKQKKGEQS